MSQSRIIEEVSNFDVIAITSIFTQQTSRCFEISNMVKNNFPEKILIAGGCNARTLKEHFFENGFDFIFLSEGERAIVMFANFLHSENPPLSEISGIAFKNNNKIIVNPENEVISSLDKIPMPSWEKLPNQKYWEIGRVWGGREGWMKNDSLVKYASMFTSRGCAFKCHYCHISNEQGGEAGKIGSFRVHSVERIKNEFVKLKDIGVNYLYINDDSFLTNKKRVFNILKILNNYSFKLADVNGVNIINLFKRKNGKYVVDEELIHALYEAGFRKISLPFESGTQRIIDKYSRRKWDIERCDTLDLIRKLNKIGIVADGNFMIGYPDEEADELTNTFMLAKKQIDAGMIACQFFMVQPFPGSALYDECIANGQLSNSWNWDDMGWSKGSMFNNPKIDRNTLKYCWSLVWKLLNKESRIDEFTKQFS
ncbi:MAG: B12-binding domain-containing radical SAM protein [Gammaproteobacteria bacterium]|nr:B12-binding domain-containing radical SAM protein [Gammaproteobacteria bacterium]